MDQAYGFQHHTLSSSFVIQHRPHPRLSFFCTTTMSTDDLVILDYVEALDSGQWSSEYQTSARRMLDRLLVQQMMRRRKREPRDPHLDSQVALLQWLVIEGNKELKRMREVSTWIVGGPQDIPPEEEEEEEEEDEDEEEEEEEAFRYADRVLEFTTLLDQDRWDEGTQEEASEYYTELRNEQDLRGKGADDALDEALVVMRKVVIQGRQRLVGKFGVRLRVRRKEAMRYEMEKRRSGWRDEGVSVFSTVLNPGWWFSSGSKALAKPGRQRNKVIIRTLAAEALLRDEDYSQASKVLERVPKDMQTALLLHHAARNQIRPSALSRKLGHAPRSAAILQHPGFKSALQRLWSWAGRAL